MAYFDMTNPRYAPVRRLETTDWNHADVFNATLMQIVQNTECVRTSTSRMRSIIVRPESWNGGVFKITNPVITADSICDVYFSSESKEAAVDFEIDGDTIDGALLLRCGSTPNKPIMIDCIEIRNEVITDVG